MDIVGDGDSRVAEDDVELEVHVAGGEASQITAVGSPAVGLFDSEVPERGCLADDGIAVVLLDSKDFDDSFVPGAEFVATSVVVGLLPGFQGELEVPFDQFSHCSLRLCHETFLPTPCLLAMMDCTVAFSLGLS